MLDVVTAKLEAYVAVELAVPAELVALKAWLLAAMAVLDENVAWLVNDVIVSPVIVLAYNRPSLRR
jgi:hypothetical protein